MHYLTRWTYALVFTLAGMVATTSYAKVCDVAIDANDQMQFSKKELTVGADCKEVKLTLKHTGKLPKTAMGHNWVLTKDADYRPLMQDAIKAGPANDYLPKDDKRVIAATKLIGGGAEDTVTFSMDGLSKDESYTFFCSFPGHGTIMKGSFKIK